MHSLALAASALFNISIFPGFCLSTEFCLIIMVREGYWKLRISWRWLGIIERRGYLQLNNFFWAGNAMIEEEMSVKLQDSDIFLKVD